MRRTSKTGLNDFQSLAGFLLEALISCFDLVLVMSPFSMLCEWLNIHIHLIRFAYSSSPGSPVWVMKLAARFADNGPFRRVCRSRTPDPCHRVLRYSSYSLHVASLACSVSAFVGLGLVELGWPMKGIRWGLSCSFTAGPGWRRYPGWAVYIYSGTWSLGGGA